MKRAILILLALVAIDQLVVAQDIYTESLKYHLENLMAVDAIRNKTVYVERIARLTDELPDSIYSLRIVYLSKDEIRYMTKHKSGIDIIVITPAKMDSAVWRVNVIDFYVTSDRKSFNYSNGGGSIIEFTYDCNFARFRVENKKYIGF